MNTTRHSQHHRHPGSDGDHGNHDTHAGHDPVVFRRLFWANLVLAVPVLVFSDQIQDWFGYSIGGAWAAWVAPVLGHRRLPLGWPAVPERCGRRVRIADSPG